jgi:hypothetical protein
LSRACLGKKIAFINKWLNEDRFLTGIKLRVPFRIPHWDLHGPDRHVHAKRKNKNAINQAYEEHDCTVRSDRSVSESQPLTAVFDRTVLQGSGMLFVVWLRCSSSSGLCDHLGRAVVLQPCQHLLQHRGLRRAEVTAFALVLIEVEQPGAIHDRLRTNAVSCLSCCLAFVRPSPSLSWHKPCSVCCYIYISSMLLLLYLSRCQIEES